VEQLELDRALIRRGVGLAIRMSANTLATLDSAIALQETTVEQARQLLTGEQRRFDAGESTLFLVNLRERTVIDEEIKRIQLQAKRVAAAAELSVALGLAQLNP
jgi:outer membrane protein TolC